ncbi:MAG: sugar ABC transporter ATP-binding protein [Planctomycetes bacterium]|nr:sugar ABC transporter ATP-binding protein [Planctomycetota bacterium]
MSGTLFRASDINKSFPGVQALSAADFDLKAGEVHALVGENGAGKSTLTSIIAGLAKADSGTMELYGKQYRPNGKADAEAHGIRMVMQELHLISNLSVAENIFIEKLPSRFGFIDYKKLNHDATEIMKQVGLGNVDPDMPVRLLGVGAQQMVEIAAGLSRRCRILALDEPTASLTDREIQLLFVQINKLKAEGVGIIYISHRIEEVTRIADRVTVLRDGNVISTNPTSELCVDDIICKMVGCDLEHEKLRYHSETGEVALRVVGLKRGLKVNDVSFEVRRGEVLGVAGLMGSGRTETMRAVFGADRPDSGEIYLYGASTPVKIHRPRDAVRNGIAFITEDRKEQGLLPELSVRVNISLTRLRGISRLGWMDMAEERSIADKYISALGVRCSSNEQTVGQLSGGNQQKVVIAKWIYRDCDVLIFDEPTRGIDIGAKFEIYRMLAELAEKGKAIIMVSSDNKELMAVCDRIMVMSAGLVAATFGPNEWNQEKIMSAAFSQYLSV